MDQVNTLREYGLFDAKVPRYTSYPPANRFETNVGARHQSDWLSALPAQDPVSVYIHIPFCRRLCWFCACRTQGTKTLKPVDAYLDILIKEIDTIGSTIPVAPPMGRLHLGGGTPTLLNVAQMTRLLDTIERNFDRASDYEFSVEIDPTEASDEILDMLAERGMQRASIGVQDFDPKVQAAIGRAQSFEQTKRVVDRLRASGVHSLNIDLLYGLPFQTTETLIETLDRVASLAPDRLALYGYAHVPHMSKRQAVIPSDELPNPIARFESAQIAKERLIKMGYEVLGIDHFALPHDSLAAAARTGTMKRNFQGYTDDPCDTLLGFGASAISKFRQGYLQNAVATAAYQQRVQASGMAGCKGYVITSEDAFAAELIDAIMCKGAVDAADLVQHHAEYADQVPAVLQNLADAYPKAFQRNGDSIAFVPGMEALSRVVAAHCDSELQTDHIHSSAI